jgi:hypothetical protein
MPLTLQITRQEVAVYAIIIHYQDRTAFITGYGSAILSQSPETKHDMVNKRYPLRIFRAGFL